MADFQKENLELPADLRIQFTKLNRRLRKAETAMALGFAISACCLTFTLLFFSDRFWNTPVPLRSILWFSAAGAVIASALFWTRRWILQPRAIRNLARLVQRRHRRLGDRLLGMVELADPALRPAAFSPRLYQAAIDQVAAEARQIDFASAVNTRPAYLAAGAGAALVILAMIPWIISPPAAYNTFLRWSSPAAKISRYSLVNFAQTPDSLVVPQGEPFDLVAPVEYRSRFWRPSAATLAIPNQRDITSSVQDGAARFSIPGLFEEAVLNLRVGDATAQIPIDPVHRPTLLSLTAAITPPDYLGYPMRTQDLRSARLAVVQGSSMTVSGRINRSLKHAALEFAKRSSNPLRVQGDTFELPSILLEESAEGLITWTDIHGISNRAPWRITAEVSEDFPPRPFIDLPPSTALLETEVFELTTTAEDDYGVKISGLAWRPLLDASPDEIASDRQLARSYSEPGKLSAEERFFFSPSLFNVPAGGSIELRAFANDAFPGRTNIYSTPRVIHVVGVAEHAELIRRRLESLLSQVEEVTRQQENTLLQTRDELAQAQDRQQDGEVSEADSESTERLGEMARDQLENAMRLQQMAREGMETLREAMRNAAFSDEALAEWSNNFQTMDALSGSQMSQAAQALQTAQNNPAQSSPSLETAEQKEQEALDQLQELQEQVNQSLDQLQAMTLAQRLRQIGKDEDEIHGSLREIVDQTIGLFPEELPAPLLRANQSLAKDQLETHQESEQVQSEISRFFERTQQAPYGEVSEEMRTTRAASELLRLNELIGKNVSMEAMQDLGDWSERFEAWAKKLEPPPSESGSGSGQGSGSEGENAIQLLTSLLRLREGEMLVREQTRLTDGDSGVEPDSATLQKLVDAQQLVQSKSLELSDRIQTEMLKAPIAEAVGSMEEALAGLTTGKTGAETTDAQLSAVRLLSDAINIVNEQAQSSSSQSSESMAQQMAFMMQMMSPTPSDQPPAMQSLTGGTGINEGTTSQTPGAIEGDPNASSSAPRSGMKTSSFSQNPPAEFRDAMQLYYRQIETQQP